ncbi:MAG: alpha/beta hydrolase [Burkholderiaceae bacterium]
MPMRRVPIGSLTFDVDVEGPDDGTPVLLLHGFPQCRHAWRETLAALAGAGLRGIAPDQRGYSPGARPLGTGHYLAERIVDDALGLADALGADRFHLVGHDWGGQIAWMTAARAPQRIRSLTVLSRPHPAAFAWAMRNDPEQAARSGHHQRLLDPAAPAAIRQDRMAGLRARLAEQGVPASAIDAYCTTLEPPGALEAAIEWYRASAQAMREPGFPVIGAPTLYVWGSADSTVGRMAAEATARFVDGPYRFIEVPGAGHFLTDDSASVVDDALLAHLAAHPG